MYNEDWEYELPMIVFMDYPLKFPLPKEFTISELMYFEMYNYPVEKAIHNNHQVIIRTNNSKGKTLLFRVEHTYECAKSDCDYSLLSYHMLHTEEDKCIHNIKKKCPKCGGNRFIHSDRDIKQTNVRNIFMSSPLKADLDN